MLNRVLAGAMALALVGCVANDTPTESSSSTPDAISSSPASSVMPVSSIASSSSIRSSSSLAASSIAVVSSSQAPVSSAAASSTAPVASECAQSVEAGQTAYSNCVNCHGAVGSNGVTTGGSPGGVIAPTDSVWGKNNYAISLSQYINDYMGSFSGCTGDCADNVAAYLTSKTNQAWCPESGSSSSSAPVVPAVTVPAIIQSEDFIAAEDSTPENKGNCGDMNQAVDLQPKAAGGGTCDVNWTDAGEWLEYKIAVPEDKIYNIAVSLAATNTNKTVTVSIDGVAVGQATSPANGWTAFGASNINNVALDAGEHIVRVTMNTGAANFDFIEFTLSNNQSGIEGDATRGKTLYMSAAQGCAGCHGENGEGLGIQKIYSDRQEFIVGSEVLNLPDYLRKTMPRANPDLCGAQCSADIAAYISAQNWNVGVEEEKPIACDGGTAADHLNSPLRMLTQSQLSHLLADTFAPLNLNAGNIAKDLADDTVLAGFATNYGKGANFFQIAGLDKWGKEIGTRAANNYSALMGCAITTTSCVDNYLKQYGRLLFRRSLTTAEVTTFKAIATAAGGGKPAVEAVTLALILAPQTNYEMYAATTTRKQLTGAEIAAKLAFLIWDRAPDDALIAAGEAGELQTAAQVKTKAEQMLADPRAFDGIAFFYDNWLSLNALKEEPQGGATGAVTLENLKGECASTAQCQGKYTGATDCKISAGAVCYCGNTVCGIKTGTTANIANAQSARDEVARLSAYLTLEQNGTLGDIFTSRTAIVDADLAKLYDVSTSGAPLYRGGSVVQLNPQQRAGLLTRSGFMRVGAHELDSGISARGNNIRTNVLCDPIPEPSADILAQFPKLPPDYDLTFRQKLEEVHLKAGGACQGCHELMDPIGFMFENYDGLGRYRTEYTLVDKDPAAGQQAGPTLTVNVDSTGMLLERIKPFDLPQHFDSALDFSEALAGSDTAAECYATKWFIRANGRFMNQGDICSADALFTRFKNNNYSLKEMIYAIVTSSSFRFRNPDAQ